MERGERVLRAAAREVDRRRVDAAGSQAGDEGRHARRGPACAVPEKTAADPRPQRTGARRAGGTSVMARSGHGRLVGGPVILGVRMHRGTMSLHATARRSPLAAPPRVILGVLTAMLVALLGSVGARAVGSAGRRPDRDADRQPDAGPTPTPSLADPDADPAPERDRPRRDDDLLRARLRPRRRDVAVRRARPGAGRPGRDDDPRPLLPRRHARDRPDDDAHPRPGPADLEGDLRRCR